MEIFANFENILIIGKNEIVAKAGASSVWV
jgi:hypothetical protein